MECVKRRIGSAEQNCGDDARWISFGDGEGKATPASLADELTTFSSSDRLNLGSEICISRVCLVRGHMSLLLIGG